MLVCYSLYTQLHLHLSGRSKLRFKQTHTHTHTHSHAHTAYIWSAAVICRVKHKQKWYADTPVQKDYLQGYKFTENAVSIAVFKDKEIMFQCNKWEQFYPIC